MPLYHTGQFLGFNWSLPSFQSTSKSGLLVPVVLIDVAFPEKVGRNDAVGAITKAGSFSRSSMFGAWSWTDGACSIDLSEGKLERIELKDAFSSLEEGIIWCTQNNTDQSHRKSKGKRKMDLDQWEPIRHTPRLGLTQLLTDSRARWKIEKGRAMRGHWYDISYRVIINCRLS